ncbi:hypothetical protein BT96DRAFT_1010460 [Gymnopus androsaceus JB14]|uniref:Uncharacterized protein n=1 Tax=Gymnopus androsaceus JB14 TaxID=1447944 RepID=A0A6A4GAP0_9AGAR|nr:hypothetical protein BT96DRAFT_1010460 [Gymnopus androsaceus JB14]
MDKICLLYESTRETLPQLQCNFIASLYWSFFCKGSRSVCVSSASALIDHDTTVGFVAFANVHNGWFDTVHTTPWFDVAPGFVNTFFSTSPLCDDDVGSAAHVSHTIKTTRSLAEL